MVRSAEELFAFERMTAQNMATQQVATTLGLPLSTTTRWLQMLRSESEMVPRSVGRSRGAEAGLCLASIRFVPMSRSVRDVVRFFNGFRVVGHVISVFVPHQRWMSELQSRQIVRSLVFASDSKQRTSKTAAPPSPSKRRRSID